jgi:hypothetical protein
MIPIPFLLDAFNLTRNKLNKWSLSKHLRRQLPEGSAGRPTLVDKPAGIEIGLMAALTAAGFNPSDAHKVTRNYFSSTSTSAIRTSPFIIFNRMRGTMHPVLNKNSLNADSFLGEELLSLPSEDYHRPGVAFALINMQELRERVDLLEKEWELLGQKEAH